MRRKPHNRDANNWRIPREGTVSRRIYNLLRKGRSTGEIIEITGKKPNTVAVLIWKIRNPDTANLCAIGYSADQAKEVIAKRQGVAC